MLILCHFNSNGMKNSRQIDTNGSPNSPHNPNNFVYFTEQMQRLVFVPNRCHLHIFTTFKTEDCMQVRNSSIYLFLLGMATG